jgi:hypothetical protein
MGSGSRSISISNLQPLERFTFHQIAKISSCGQERLRKKNFHNTQFTERQKFTLN